MGAGMGAWRRGGLDVRGDGGVGKNPRPHPPSHIPQTPLNHPFAQPEGSTKPVRSDAHRLLVHEREHLHTPGPGHRPGVDRDIRQPVDRLRELPVDPRPPADGVSHYQPVRDTLRIAGMSAKLFIIMLTRLPAVLISRSTGWSPAPGLGSEHPQAHPSRSPSDDRSRT